MVSKSLSAVWALFALCLLAASGVLIAFSVIWGMPNMLIQFVVDSGFLKAGMGLGITYAVTFVVALIAIVQPNHVTMGLAALNWVLLLDSIATIVVGSVIWFFTLKERSTFGAKWLVTSEPVRLAIQNQFSCCGYFGGNETGVAIGGFCANATFAANRNTTACVSPLVEYADYTLNNIFTSVYGFMAILVGLFLASLCVINQRIEAERFRKIDAKRGGKGFV